MQAGGDQLVHQVHSASQGQNDQTVSGELDSSPTGEQRMGQHYISPLPTRAPRGYMSDPNHTLDHAGQARYFEPNFQQWQAQVQHQQQAQVQQYQWGPQAQQWGQQMQYPAWGASTGNQQWGPQCRPQQVQASFLCSLRPPVGVPRCFGV